jgi:hypothetical protein
MQTNTRLPDALQEKAFALIDAAEDYWQEYRRILNPSAVVWLKADNGQFVLFSRGEYLNQIMSVVDRINQKGKPLEYLFGDAKDED